MDPMGYITSTKHQTRGLKLPQTLQRKTHFDHKKNWQSWDAEKSQNGPLKKKNEMVSHGIHKVSRRFGCKFQDLKLLLTKLTNHRGRVSRIPKCHELKTKVFYTAPFFQQRNFFSKQVKVNQCKVRNVRCVSSVLFGKDTQLRLGKHSEKHPIHLEKWTRLIC